MGNVDMEAKVVANMSTIAWIGMRGKPISLLLDMDVDGWTAIAGSASGLLPDLIPAWCFQRHRPFHGPSARFRH